MIQSSNNPFLSFSMQECGCSTLWFENIINIIFQLKIVIYYLFIFAKYRVGMPLRTALLMRLRKIHTALSKIKRSFDDIKMFLRKSSLYGHVA